MIPWGYYLIKADRDIIPEFSGCQCLNGKCTVLPDYDCIPSDSGAFEVVKLAKRCGISTETAQRLYLRNCELFDLGKIIFFNPRYTDFQTARELKSQLFRNSPEWNVFGVLITSPEMKKMPEFKDLPPLPEGGTILGFDLYGIYFFDEKPDWENVCCGIGCPFRHCDVDGKIPAEMGIELTPYGLYPDAESAERIAQYVMDKKLGEPEHYATFGIVRYEECT